MGIFNTIEITFKYSSRTGYNYAWKQDYEGQTGARVIKHTV